ncbi:TonB-dependent receptor [Sinomicrobium sp. M5D2P9]
MENKIVWIWAAFLLLIFSGELKAQSILSGTVMDDSGKFPLVSAHVEINGTAQVKTTNKYGTFEIQDIKFPVSLIVSHLGYRSLSITFTEPKEDLVIRLSKQEQYLDEVVVTAFEGSRKLMETPSAIGNLDVRDLDRYNLLSPQQALSTLPGVKMESTTIGRYSIKIRGGGLGVTGHSDNYKMYWNDIPITIASGGAPLGELDFGSIGTVNVIRGPSGSIYGAGLHGVVLLENRKPAYQETSLQTDGLWGSYGSHRYSAIFSTSGQKGDIRLQYSNVHTDGYRDESASDNQFVNLTARLFPSEKQSLSFIAQYTDRSYGIPGNISAGQVAENPRQSSFSPELDNGLTGKNLLVGAAHSYRWNDRWENNTSFSYQVYEGDFLIGNDFFKVADRNITTTFSARSAMVYNFKGFGGMDARWVFGGEFTRGIHDVNEFSDGFESPINSARTTTDQSVLAFSQLEMELPAGFTFTLGASYNNFRLDFEERLMPMDVPRFSKEVNDFSPRVALMKKFNNKLYAYANVSKGFSPPPRGAIDNNGTNINFDLESAKGWNKELGVRGKAWKDRLAFDMVFYRLDEKDVIVPRVTSNTGGIDFIINENAGAIDRQGIELWAEYFWIKDTDKWISNARSWSSYSYMDHKFQTYNTVETDTDNVSGEVSFDGKYIPGVHPHTWVLGSDIQSKTGLYLNTTFSYYDKIYLNNSNTDTTAPYRLLDVKIGFKKKVLNNIQLNVYAGGNNLLDNEYSSMTAFNAFSGAYYDPAPKSNFYSGISLKYDF